MNQDLQVNEWKSVWDRSGVERELRQIEFESFSTDFRGFFKKGDVNSKVIMVEKRDLYYPMYDILNFVLKRDFWSIKHLLKKIINPAQGMPILSNFNSGIHFVLQKPNCP